MSPWISWPDSRKVLPTSRALISGLRHSTWALAPRSVCAGSVRGSVCARSWKWQRERRTGPISYSGGASVRQRSWTSPQRPAKMQPLMVSPGRGRKPGMVSSAVAMLVGVATRDAPQQAHGVRMARLVKDLAAPVPPRRARRRTEPRPGRTSCAITPRLWLMNSSEVPNSWRSALTRSSTSASTVASSAVVGSSRINSDGSEASAIAITVRCSMPPDSWCGYRRITRGGI